MMRQSLEVTEAGRAFLSSVRRPESLPLGGRIPLITLEITPAGEAYLAQHRDERVSPDLRKMLVNPARRST